MLHCTVKPGGLRFKFLKNVENHLDFFPISSFQIQLQYFFKLNKTEINSMCAIQGCVYPAYNPYFAVFNSVTIF